DLAALRERLGGVGLGAGLGAIRAGPLPAPKAAPRAAPGREPSGPGVSGGGVPTGDLSGPARVRGEPGVGAVPAPVQGGPAAGAVPTPVKGRSARWSGWLRVPRAGPYVLTLTPASGRARLWIDGVLTALALGGRSQVEVDLGDRPHSLRVEGEAIGGGLRLCW